MKRFMYKLVTPNSGVSSKRFIGLIASFSVIIIAFVDLFTNLTVSDYVFEGLIWLAIGGMGFTWAESFVKRNINNDNTNDNPPPSVSEDECIDKSQPKQE